MAQPLRLSLDQAKEKVLFRIGRGSRWNFLEIKGVAGHTPPGHPRHQAAQLPQHSVQGGTRLAANCPSFTVFQQLKKLFLL